MTKAAAVAAIGFDDAASVNDYVDLVILDGFGVDELHNGASTTFLVPDGETAPTRVTPGILADEVFAQPQGTQRQRETGALARTPDSCRVTNDGPDVAVVEQCPRPM